MHLGFLTSEYPHSKSTKSGGIGTSIKNMVESLLKTGITVSIFIYDQPKDEIIRNEKLNIYFIKKREFPVLGWYLHRKFLQNYLNRHIVNEKINALEAPDWTGITAFMKLKCPLVIRIHGSDTYFCHLENRPQKKKNFWFEKNALRSADHVVSVSHFAAKISKELFGLDRNIAVIPNSLNLENFTPHHQDVIPKRILYFGSILRKKGVLELAEIFNLVNKKEKESTLIMAGKDVIDPTSGKSTKNMFETKLSEDAKAKVEWLGDLSYENVQIEIMKAEMVVLPSLAEALPMTWLEAMALEKPLVTSNIGWAREIMINGETGYTEDPLDHKRFAGKLINLMNNDLEASEMGKNARKQVIKKFSSNEVVKKNLGFYKSIT